MIRHSRSMYFETIWLRRALRISFLLIIFLLSLIVFSAAQSAPDPWSAAAQEMARAVLSRAGSPSNISLEVRNISALNRAEMEEVRQKLREQFNAARVQIVGPERALAEVTITLSQDLKGEIWVAEIRHGEAREIAMVRVAKSNAAVLPRMSGAISLRKTQVWTEVSAEPVLDVATLGEGERSALLVLDAASVSLYRNRGSHWELEQSAPVPRSQPWPRDLRGRLAVDRDHKFEGFLPGKKCLGAADPGVSMNCADSDDPWPLDGEGQNVRGFFGARNFFTGALAGTVKENNVAPFFSAAVGQDSSIWFAQTSGGLGTGAGKTASMTSGSDIASVHSECGSGSQLLVSGAGDFTEKDTLRAVEVQNGVLVTAGSPLEFNGPITALWTAREGNAAVAVSKNLTTGKYEAFTVSITCR